MKKKRILIVEDEQIVAEDIKMGLRRLGYTVSGVVTSGEEAIKKAQETHPDLVLMDIILGGNTDGIQAAEILQSRFDIPVIFLTAYADKKTIERAKKTEPFGYIVKPFEDRELNSTIEISLYRHRLENLLKESEENYRELADSIADIFFALDKDLRYTYWNKASEDLTGIKAKDAIGKSLYELFPDVKGTKAERSYLNVSRKKKPLSFEQKYQVKRKNFIFEINVYPSKHGLSVFVKDITGRKKAEEELRCSREQLRNLTAHLQSMREQERTFVAREMHEELAQLLTALKIDLSLLNAKLPKNQKSLLEKTKSMSRLIDKTLHTAKRISTELRPGLLDDLGLAAAIEWQGDEFQNRTGIRCEVTVDSPDMTLQQDRSTAIFRIFQEALTNIALHAHATRVKVSLKEKAGKVELRVRDNGIGITQEQISDSKSFGIIGIRERAHLFGGKIEIKGVQNKGTTLTISIPLPKKG